MMSIMYRVPSAFQLTMNGSSASMCMFSRSRDTGCASEGGKDYNAVDADSFADVHRRPMNTLAEPHPKHLRTPLQAELREPALPFSTPGNQGTRGGGQPILCTQTPSGAPRRISLGLHALRTAGKTKSTVRPCARGSFSHTATCQSYRTFSGMPTMNRCRFFPATIIYSAYRA